MMVSPETNLSLVKSPIFKKITHFLCDGTTSMNSTPASLHIISAWSWSTLLSYNSAVKKYIGYHLTRDGGDFQLPLSVTDLENFCLWAGRTAYGPETGKITSKSLKKYLIGLKAWHNFHAAAYPEGNKA
jgi:hypothetical protein